MAVLQLSHLDPFLCDCFIIYIPDVATFLMLDKIHVLTTGILLSAL